MAQAKPGQGRRLRAPSRQVRLGTWEHESGERRGEERDSDRVTLTGTGNMTTERTGKLANTALNETVE